MQEYRKNLGKVSLTAEGAWTKDESFDILSIVYDEHTLHGFISKQFVPKGVDLYNKEYWMPFNVSGYADNNIIILSEKTSETAIKAYTLEEAINSVATVGRRPGMILGFYNENTDRLDIGGRWEIWQFNSTTISEWEDIAHWQNIYYSFNKFVGWYRDVESLKKYNPFPEIGCYAYVGTEFNEATIYRCDTKFIWTDTTQHAWDYIKVVVQGNVTIGENGNWFNNGVDTNIPASIKGENGKTPVFRQYDNTIQYSFDNVNWITISDKVAAWFRWNATTGDTQANNVGRIQISRDNVTWTNLSGDIINKLHISRYIGADESLPTSGIAEGTIYAKGPYYAEDDTLNDNPIYRLWVYAWKGNTLAWQDNGEFTSIAAGVVQETGDSETEVMSQKATTEKLTELASILGGKYTIVDKTTEVKSTMTDSYINYFDGTKVNSSSVKSSDYVNIQGFERLIITLGVTTESWTNVGLAFYSSADESSYISGVGFDVNAAATGFVTKQLDVPHGAMYFRTSIYRQNVEDFLCKFIKIVEKGQLELLEDEIEGLDEKVEDINDDIDRIASHPTMDEVIKTDSKTTSIASHDTKINLSVGVRYDIKAKTDTISSGGTDSKIGVYYMYGDSYDKIYTCTAQELYQGISFEYTPTQDGHLEIRTMEAGTRYHISATYQKLLSETIESIEDLYITQNKEGVSVTTGVDGNELFTLKPNKKYKIYAKTATIVSSPGASLGLWITDPNSDLGVSALFVCTSQELYQGITFEYTPLIESILYLRTYEKGTEYFASISYIFRNEELFEMSNSNSNKIKKINNVINTWENKNVVVYGDSITAQGNGDNAECVNSYFHPAYKKFGFKNLYVRGIGGQTYMWNTGGYYSAVGSNGKYLNRYNFDSEGTQLSTTVSPIRTTAEEKANIESFYGKSIEIHYGAFCSWDRITSMIPSDIRESIDLIIVCGGTNDHLHIEEIIVDGEIAANEPIWKPNDKTDPTWGASSMYLGGDYDINTLSGAIASTVMKMQTWCPNAVVVLATPFPAFDTTTKQQLINNAGLSFRNLCKIEADVAGIIGIDVIDANGKCGINGANFYLYQTDGTHPNAEGSKMYSRVFNGELNRIAAKEK